MGKTTGPLLSLRASGTIAKTLTFSAWRGISYARQCVTPANPQTTAQMSIRNVFSWLSAAWKMLPTIGIEPYQAAVLGRPLTDRNQFARSNIPVLKAETSIADVVGSPGCLGGAPPESVTATGGAGTVDVTVVEGALPTGWTVAKAQCCLYPEQDPHQVFSGEVEAQEKTDSPYTLNFTGLEAGDYIATAWLVYTRPDERTAFGPSANDAASAT